MTGKSYQTSGQTLFMYRAHNFTREKDSLLGCNIVVSEVLNSKLVAREDPPADDAAAGDEADVPPAVGPEAAAAAAAAGGPEASEVEAAPLATGPPRAAEELSPATPEVPNSSGKDAAIQSAAAVHPAAANPGAAAANAGDVGALAADSPERKLQGPAQSEAPAAEPAVGAAAAPDAAGRRLPGASLVEQATPPPRAAAGPARPGLGVREADAAAFVHGLDKKRGEMAQRILSEVTEVVKAGSTADADAAAFEQALTKLREAREAQSTCERNIQSAARKATDTWAEASATAVAGLLQKELGKISDGVAATLAQQLCQSKKFCEALARGVQKSGGVATKQALEALRLPKQLQETVGTALSDALHESLAPVFRAELRLHFEQELAPLIEKRVGEMMASFRDRMGKCLEAIAAEHEQAGQRLCRELAPVVAEELQQVERIISQQRVGAAASSSSLSESQLDELARAVQTEVVQPLHARIQDLTAQVQALRAESRRLEERWQACSRAQAAAARSGPSEREEEEQASELEAKFREGQAESAFINAMHLQVQANHCDFLDRLCTLVPEGSLEEWLAGEGNGGCPMKNQVKMLLMLSLAKQLEAGDLPEQVRERKIEWLTELWFVFDPTESAVADNAATLCAQLIEALNRIQPGGCSSEAAAQLRRLKKGVQQFAKVLRDKS
eukprot:CAMPEP_0175488958 /NCGR_PEP_ID=MMETSP0096-20121207/505_1 /TAXON_ID=311494 /ORGANISM="Alexandrium monilatum, Strain CCMP3105" /LENGTH=674 /DNA_ID=CAMNT_0016790847 /DNA_START=22 /DNA_END=2047 /DNA_ORIENTATION=+